MKKKIKSIKYKKQRGGTVKQAETNNNEIDHTEGVKPKLQGINRLIGVNKIIDSTLNMPPNNPLLTDPTSEIAELLKQQLVESQQDRQERDDNHEKMLNVIWWGNFWSIIFQILHFLPWLILMLIIAIIITSMIIGVNITVKGLYSPIRKMMKFFGVRTKPAPEIPEIWVILGNVIMKLFS